jgi:hypothetical protein
MKFFRAAVLTLLALGSLGCAGLHVVPATEWGGVEPTGGRPQTVTLLTVHHQGEYWPPDRDVPAYLRRLQRWSRETKGWVDVPYHFIIAPDGKIYAGRPVAIAGDTNTEYDPLGHLQVMLLGNFEEQIPTSRQFYSAVRLIAHLAKVHGLPPSSIGAHLHRSKQTVCPGANLMSRFEELRAAALMP